MPAKPTRTTSKSIAAKMRDGREVDAAIARATRAAARAAAKPAAPRKPRRAA
jgi:hypothetical protein